MTTYSWLGTSTTSSSYSFIKRGPGETPSVSVSGGDSQSFLMSSFFKVATVLAPKSVCKGKQVRETFQLLTGAAAALHANHAMEKDFVLNSGTH